MALLSGVAVGIPRLGDTFHLDMGGSESNVAIGVSRLGHSTAWISRVGGDVFGHMILNTLRGEGVDVSVVNIDDESPTGLMVGFDRSSTSRVVNYWRSSSAATSISPANLPRPLLADSSHFHTSGITTAISASARATALEALAVARSHGVPTSFDFNHRSSLWSPDEATSAFREALPLSDVVFASYGEATMVVDARDPIDAIEMLADFGPSEVVVTLGEDGCVASNGSRTIERPGRATRVVDPTGAGDAFVAGYLTARLEAADFESCLELAQDVAVVAVATEGDWRGLPHRSELESLSPASDGHTR